MLFHKISLTLSLSQSLSNSHSHFLSIFTLTLALGFADAPPAGALAKIEENQTYSLKTPSWKKNNFLFAYVSIEPFSIVPSIVWLLSSVHCIFSRAVGCLSQPTVIQRDRFTLARNFIGISLRALTLSYIVLYWSGSRSASKVNALALKLNKRRVKISCLRNTKQSKIQTVKKTSLRSDATPRNRTFLFLISSWESRTPHCHPRATALARLTLLPSSSRCCRHPVVCSTRRVSSESGRRPTARQLVRQPRLLSMILH